LNRPRTFLLASARSGAGNLHIFFLFLFGIHISAHLPVELSTPASDRYANRSGNLKVIRSVLPFAFPLRETSDGRASASEFIFFSPAILPDAFSPTGMTSSAK